MPKCFNSIMGTPLSFIHIYTLISRVQTLRSDPVKKDLRNTPVSQVLVALIAYQQTKRRPNEPMF